MVRVRPGGSQDIGGGELRVVGSWQPGTYYFRAAIAFHKPAVRTAFVPAGEVRIEER